MYFLVQQLRLHRMVAVVIGMLCLECGTSCFSQYWAKFTRTGRSGIQYLLLCPVTHETNTGLDLCFGHSKLLWQFYIVVLQLGICLHHSENRCLHASDCCFRYGFHSGNRISLPVGLKQHLMIQSILRLFCCKQIHRVVLNFFSFLG
jgi:hypothetical protein